MLQDPLANPLHPRTLHLSWVAPRAITPAPLPPRQTPPGLVPSTLLRWIVPDRRYSILILGRRPRTLPRSVEDSDMFAPSIHPHCLFSWHGKRHISPFPPPPPSKTSTASSQQRCKGPTFALSARIPSSRERNLSSAPPRFLSPSRNALVRIVTPFAVFLGGGRGEGGKGSKEKNPPCTQASILAGHHARGSPTNLKLL